MAVTVSSGINYAQRLARAKTKARKTEGGGGFGGSGGGPSAFWTPEGDRSSRGSNLGGDTGIIASGRFKGMTKQEAAATVSDEQQRADFEESAKAREFGASETEKAFQRKTGFAREILGGFKGGVSTGAELQGPSESERLLIQAQEEAGDKSINRLQDVLSSAGILSSGQLAVGTGEILGATRGAVARTSAGFAENRLTRKHQNLLSKRQQLTSLIQSVLL